MSKVLVACEFSGVVRDAFEKAGHYAWSCDFLPTEIHGFHFQGDVRKIISEGWDLMIAHPPCTYLARSGCQHWPGREVEQEEALDFVRMLMDAPIPRIAIENPPGRIGTAIRKADQYIEPWQFGHEETKHTGLWLKNLPPLQPTNIVEKRDRNLTAAGHNRVGQVRDRWKIRSRTYPGIARAMAEQWGPLAADPPEQVSHQPE